MSGTIVAMQRATRAIEATDPGYDQGQRLSGLRTWVNPTLSDIVANAEFDCSSICGAIAALGGFPVNLSNPFYTGNFKDRLEAAEFTAMRFASLTQVRAGDFVVRPGHHVEFVYSGEGTGATFYSARSDEHGKASGGQAGDQTGREVRFSPAYNYTGGWVWILRPPASAGKPEVASTPASDSTPAHRPAPTHTPTQEDDMTTPARIYIYDGQRDGMNDKAHPEYGTVGAVLDGRWIRLSTGDSGPDSGRDKISAFKAMCDASGFAREDHPTSPDGHFHADLNLLAFHQEFLGSAR